MYKIRAIALLAGLCICALPAFSQEVTAGITGRVTDPSGASISGATVTAKDLARGTEWPARTNSDGVYAYPRLPVGSYSLTIENPGFKKYMNPSIALEVNQRARVDVQMEIGSVSENVEVTGEAPLLQTDTTQVGAVMSSRTIENTPLISRNPIALTLLTAGVTTPNPSGFNSGTRTGGGGRPYVNGNREEANNFLLDGIDNNQVSDNLSSYQPNLDAVEEFKMITNNASAEFGNFQGGIVNVVIKSGTNQFHGDVFEYFRNDIFNADNWARNWQGLDRSPLRWNQFGGTLGGPIVKDRLFFFADYQGLRRAIPTQLSTTTVFPAAWRQGDFSSLLDTSFTGAKAPIQLYNPYTADPVTGNRLPFAGNRIPRNLLDPGALNLLNDTSLYPLPTKNTIQNNYAYGNASYINTDQGDAKVDWRPNEKDYYTVRYSNGRQDQPALNSFPLFYNTFNTSPFQNGVINWTRTFSPSVVNEARAGVNRIVLENGGTDKGLGNIAADAGIQNTGPGLLSLNPNNFAYAAGLGSMNIGTQQLFANTTFQYVDNLTIIRGTHQMKMGGQFLRQRLNTFYAGNNGRTGYMNFSGRYTASNYKNPTGTQIGEADFMLGLPSDLGRGLSTGTWGQRGNIIAAYFQDDWRATSHLTLNLGLRWEYHSPWVEVEDRQSNFDLFTGELKLAGKDGNSRALYEPFKKDFQPRVGFAYTAGRLVVRGAYTISSFLEGTGTNLRLPLNPPFNSEFQALYNTPDFILPTTTLDQGLAGLNPKDPFKGATLRIWDPFVRPSNVQQWNLSTEYQLPGQTVLTLGYVGQHGTHLMVPMPYRQKQLVNGVVQPSAFLAGNPTLLSEIAQISGTASIGNQKYNSLQATLRKRFTSGLEYQVAYTWAHGESDAIGYYGEGGQAGSQSAYWQNLYNQKAEWGPTYFDVRHNLTGSFVYELPFGAGRKYGSSWNRAVDAFLGGWQVGGIFTAHTGFPLTIKMSGDPSGTLARSFRANVIGTPDDPHQIGPGELFLDPTAYAVPGAFTFGNAGVGIVNGPGMIRFDFSLGKRFYITEHKYFEFRGEAFNLTNTPIFSSPVSQTITSPLFGQIQSSQGERNVQLAGKFYF
ncbi:MAG TPA: carboxypeptidase regulatory-like domain-containing protein [Bryobacteraceae bacterium]